jgi:hypothetical protein
VCGGKGWASTLVEVLCEWRRGLGGRGRGRGRERASKSRFEVESWFLYDRVSCGDGKSTTSWMRTWRTRTRSSQAGTQPVARTPVVGGSRGEEQAQYGKATLSD